MAEKKLEDSLWVRLTAYLAAVGAVGLFLFGLFVMNPCESEDGHNCFWNAAQQGNGVGKSFIDIFGWVIYFD